MSNLDKFAKVLDLEISKALALVHRREAGEHIADFDIRGKLYDLGMSLAPNSRREDLREMFDLVRPMVGETGIDIAAGTGFFTKPFRVAVGEGGSMIAIDPSKEMLGAITRDAGKTIQTIVGSPDKGTMSQIADRSANFVTSFGGLHHVQDQRQMMEELDRVLVPGGRFTAADVCGGTALATHFDEFVATKSITGHTATWLTEGRLRELTAGLDLDVINTRIVPLTWWFTSEREMALFFKGIHAYDLNESEIVADLNNALGTRMQDGLIGLNWPMIFFHIRKGE